MIKLLRVHARACPRPTTFHSRVTIATPAMIHKSNLARSIANSIIAANNIERDAIRFIARVQTQEIRRAQPEFLETFLLLSLLLPAAAQRLIDLYECYPLVELGLHQVEFR